MVDLRAKRETDFPNDLGPHMQGGIGILPFSERKRWPGIRLCHANPSCSERVTRTRAHGVRRGAPSRRLSVEKNQSRQRKIKDRLLDLRACRIGRRGNIRVGAGEVAAARADLE